MTESIIDSAIVGGGDPLAGTAYRMVRAIGAGGMGQVLEAEHAGLKRRVAVKLLKPALAADAGFVDRLRLEAQALASIRHPNVVGVFDHASTPAGVPFLAMELLRGRTLEAALQERGAMALPEALEVMAQVLAGLGAIHAAGLIHRDLKPANVFLSEEAGGTVVKLLDFGIVKLSTPSLSPSLSPLAVPTAEHHAVGTPRFMSPEQALGQPCDGRSDVYAAGVLLYMLLSGRDPFHHHHTHLAILGAHVVEAPEPLATAAAQVIPAAIEKAVARALAKRPAERFGSVAELAAAIGAAGAAERREPARGPSGTEKIPAGAFGHLPRKTTPMRATPRREVVGAPPARPGAGVKAPGEAVAAPGAPLPEMALAKVAPSFALPLARPAGASAGRRGLLAVVVALWACLALLAWRVYAGAG